MHVYVRTMQHTAGTFPPLLCLRHKSRENIHWLLIECVFPFARSCFCRKQGFPPSVSLGVQGTLRERDHRDVFTMLALSLSTCPGLNDSSADARLRSISFSGCRERRLGQLRSRFCPEGRDRTACCHKRRAQGAGRPRRGWHRDPAKDSQVAGRRLGTIDRGNERPPGLGGGGCGSRPSW